MTDSLSSKYNGYKVGTKDARFVTLEKTFHNVLLEMKQ